MLIALLALAATTTAEPDHPSGWKPPSWNKRPTSDAIQAVWPAKPLKEGREGVAKINCRVNIKGVTEDCRVQSETPPGFGFGAAALILTPDFLFNPATTPAGPVAARVVIPISFKWPVGARGAEISPNAFTVINHPVWAGAPTFADLAVVYPKGGAGKSGYDAFRCDVAKTGVLKDCVILREEPPGKGFGGAGRALIPKFHVELDADELAQRQPLVVNLAIRLIDPNSDDFSARRIGEPVWIKVVDPLKSQALYPAQAAEKGLTTGLGVASCEVSADGHLTACEARPGKPDRVGFSEAAVEIAGALEMSRWTQEGGPVDGARVSLPIRFNLATAKGEAAKPPP